MGSSMPDSGQSLLSRSTTTPQTPWRRTSPPLAIQVIRRSILDVPTRELLRAAGLKGRERPELLVASRPAFQRLIQEVDDAGYHCRLGSTLRTGPTAMA